MEIPKKLFYPSDFHVKVVEGGDDVEDSRLPVSFKDFALGPEPGQHGKKVLVNVEFHVSGKDSLQFFQRRIVTRRDLITDALDDLAKVANDLTGHLECVPTSDVRPWWFFEAN